MMIDDLRAAAIDLYDRFTHEGIDRRAFMADLTRLAGGAAAANALLLSIAADPAVAAVIDPADARLATTKGPLGIPGQALSGYRASLREAEGRRGSVIVIHENRGLNAHIEDVARRVALAGFNAVAPDMLSSVGGTPANEDIAREAIGKLDRTATLTQLVALVEALRAEGNGKVGAVGFCWGGAFTNWLAVTAGDKLDAAVSYYGPAPPPEEAAKVEAAIMVQLAGNDTRVNSSGEPWIAALKAAGKTVEGHVYPGVEHAFNNDTSAERYDKEAADLAWNRTLGWFRTHLA